MFLNLRLNPVYIKIYRTVTTYVLYIYCHGSIFSLQNCLYSHNKTKIQVDPFRLYPYLTTVGYKEMSSLSWLTNSALVYMSPNAAFGDLTYDPQLWSGVSARALSGPLGARRGLEKRTLTLGQQLAGRAAVWPPLSRGNTQLAHPAGAEGSSMQLALAQRSRGPFGMQTGGFGTSMKAGKQLGEVKARPQVNRSRQHGKGNSGSGNRGSVKSRPGNSGPGNSASGNSAPGSSASGNSPALESGSGEGASSRGLNGGEDSLTQSFQSEAGYSFRNSISAELCSGSVRL
jgi:hypothetical protein